MSVKNFFHVVMALLLCGVVLPDTLRAENISPAQEQEYVDAKRAMEAARQAQAEKFAPDPLKQSQDLLMTVENARQGRDMVKFSQASRLSRAYADLAKALAEFNAHSGQLAAANEAIRKVKAEIELLRTQK